MGSPEDDVDDARLRELFTEHQDLHSSELVDHRSALRDYVEVAQDARAERRQVSRRAVTVLAGAATLGLAGVALAGPALADTDADIRMLQTAAALENLAVVLYEGASTLPFVTGPTANPLVATFVQTTLAQHAQHATDYNVACVGLGSEVQLGTPTGYLDNIRAVLAGLRTVGDLVTAAITVEDLAARTFTHNVPLMSSAYLRQLFAGIAGVEAQHRAFLLTVGNLLQAGSDTEIVAPPPLTRLPAAAGTAGVPGAFTMSSGAVDPSAGAVT